MFITSPTSERVVAGHTYRHRARTLKRILMTLARRGYRITFKIGAPVSGEKESSRDFDLTQGLGRALAARGHSFRIDSCEEWDRAESLAEDIVILLPGTGRHRPKPDQINLILSVDHSDRVMEKRKKASPQCSSRFPKQRLRQGSRNRKFTRGSQRHWRKK